MKKLSLSSVKEFLSRDEMRSVSGGSGCWCSSNCSIVGMACYKPYGGIGTCQQFTCDSCLTLGCL